ncbi:MAG: hypothetical protein AB7N76_28600 [Planctomycetota bacterium]
MIALRERPSPALRCAYCHDDLAEEPGQGCARCGTRLHLECWEEVGLCLTLGCSPLRPRVVVHLQPGRFRCEEDSVLVAGLGAVIWFACAQALPAFVKMFAETGICLPPSTELLVAVPTWVWWVASPMWFLALIWKDRFVRRERLGLNLALLLLLCLTAAGIVVSLFLPLCCTLEKL